MRNDIGAGALAALALLYCAHMPVAAAAPSDYVATPIVEEGEREVDFKVGTAKLHDATRESAYSLGLGWGAKNWWFTEIYAKWHKEPRAANTFDAWEWENKFQLTETGKFPVDVGILLEIERPEERSEGYEYRWGPLFQADITPGVQANLNLLFQKHVRASELSPALFGYQWQLKRRWRAEFEYGLQGFGDVGPWTDWESTSAQSHIVGPAVFGRVRAGNHQVVRYNAGLLFGLTNGAPRCTIRAQAEYEF